MRVLIVESEPNLGRLWQRHVRRFCQDVDVETGQDGAVARLTDLRYDVILLDLVLAHGSAFAVADFAAYRYPDTKIIFVTSTTFFSDGSIFRLMPNACAFLPTETPPEDIAAVVEHYGAAN
jgi:DNA-binding response OmpR family regulator